MGKVQAEVCLVVVPQAQELPVVVFVAAFFGTKNLHVALILGGKVEIYARINASDQKFIRRKLRDECPSPMLFCTGRLRAAVPLWVAESNRRFPLAEVERCLWRTLFLDGCL